MRIATAEHASRLAKAICSDIALFNQDAIKAGKDLTSEIEEGRNLYRERVEEGLMPIFEQAVAASGLASPRRFESPAAPHPPLPPPQTMPAAPASRTGTWLIVVLVVAVAALGAWLTLGR